jgi:hypothetical protein
MNNQRLIMILFMGYLVTQERPRKTDRNLGIDLKAGTISYKSKTKSSTVDAEMLSTEIKKSLVNWPWPQRNWTKDWL